VITHQQHWANASKNRIIDESLSEREQDRAFAKYINKTGDDFNSTAVILEPHEKVINTDRVSRLMDDLEHGWRFGDSPDWLALKKELSIE